MITNQRSARISPSYQVEDYQTPAFTSIQSSTYTKKEVNYVSTQGTSQRPHAPMECYEPDLRPQISNGINLFNQQNYRQAAEVFDNIAQSFPQSLNSNHLAGVAFHVLSKNETMEHITSEIEEGCCCKTRRQITKPDITKFNQEIHEHRSKAKYYLDLAYKNFHSSTNEIRSNIAFSYAMLAQDLGDDDLKRALVSIAVDCNHDNLDALAVKEGQSRQEITANIDVQAHSSSSAIAKASAYASSEARNNVTINNR